jgi:hypothetical protein
MGLGPVALTVPFGQMANERGRAPGAPREKPSASSLWGSPASGQIADVDPIAGGGDCGAGTAVDSQKKASAASVA